MYLNVLGRVAVAMAISVSATGCLLFSAGKSLNNGGVGVIVFKDKGVTAAAAGTALVTYDIDCVDSFEATGGQTGLGNAAGEYGVSCTYQGQPIPWRIVGSFSAAPMANTTERWTKYRAKVTEMAKQKHCAAVALRLGWPTKNQEGEAFGAFCVES